MELHLMYVNVCKWTYHVSFMILTTVLLKVQVLMAVMSGQSVNGNPLLFDTLKHPKDLLFKEPSCYHKLLQSY
jgi:hypothetical protein